MASQDLTYVIVCSERRARRERRRDERFFPFDFSPLTTTQDRPQALRRHTYL